MRTALFATIALSMLSLQSFADYGLNKDEVAIPKDQAQWIKNGDQTVTIYLHDNGSNTISVRINGGNVEKLQKPSGTDTTGDNTLLLYHGSEWNLFYVNTPRGPQNYCVLKVVRFQK